VCTVTAVHYEQTERGRARHGQALPSGYLASVSMNRSCSAAQGLVCRAYYL
jgi:hypothetical protein